MWDIAPLRNRLYEDKPRSHIWFGGNVASRDQYIPSTNWWSNNYIGGIAYIYGLPIDGPLVSKITFPNAVVPEVCQELLRMAPRLRKDVNDTNIKFKWLEDNFKISKKKNEIYKMGPTCSSLWQDNFFLTRPVREALLRYSNFLETWILYPKLNNK